MIEQLGGAFVRIILPVLLVDGLGYVLGRTRPIDVLSTVAGVVTLTVLIAFLRG